MKVVEPEEKAWKYFESVVEDKEVVMMLKNGIPVELTGSEGGKYFLYPSGKVVKIGTDEPLLGGFQDGANELPKADILASAYLWITKNEKKMLSNWGCGKMKLLERNTQPRLARDMGLMVRTQKPHWGGKQDITTPEIILVAIGLLVTAGICNWFIITFHPEMLGVNRNPLALIIPSIFGVFFLWVVITMFISMDRSDKYWRSRR